MLASAPRPVYYSLSMFGVGGGLLLASGDDRRRSVSSAVGGEDGGDGDGGDEAADAYECPFCTMIKAGPCRAKFFPFNDCIDRCEKTGEESETACRESFTAMIECVAAHPNEYKKLIEELENTGSGKNKGGAAPAVVPAEDEAAAAAGEASTGESALPGAETSAASGANSEDVAATAGAGKSGEASLSRRPGERKVVATSAAEMVVDAVVARAQRER